MGYYSRELTGADWLAPASDGLLDLPAWPVFRVRCRGCGDEESMPRGGLHQVQGQIRLWHLGWRREPDTGDDYCPACEQ